MKRTNHKIEDLINPSNYQEPLEVAGYDEDLLIQMLESMLLIRMSEEKLANEREAGSIGGPVHLSAGQEAMAVGISKNLNKQDRVFGAHRSHSHILSLSPSVYKLFAEALGKNTGFSKGMGGSMHLIDMEAGFYGSVPIVSGTVSLAVGAAFEARRSLTNNVGVAFIGDGALEEGVVQESLNLASVLNAPVLFVVENNLFASHMNISLRQPSQSTTRFADVNYIDNAIVDGNNILEVYETSKSLLSKSRQQGCPGFIEGITFRHYGHVDWRKDIDVGVNRSQDDIEEWLKRDPIRRLYLGLKEASMLNKKDFDDIVMRIEEDIKKSWQKAINDPYPNSDALLSRVYSNED